MSAATATATVDTTTTDSAANKSWIFERFYDWERQEKARSCGVLHSTYISSLWVGKGFESRLKTASHLKKLKLAPTAIRLLVYIFIL